MTEGQPHYYSGNADAVRLEINTNPWYTTSFGTKDGLLSPEILCLEQDQTGYLWIGTSSGLSRFDGKKFENFLTVENKELGRVLAISEDAIKKTIWIATSKGLFLFKKNSLQSLLFKQASVAFYDIHVVPGQGIWIASDVGPFYLDYKALLASTELPYTPLEINVIKEWGNLFKGQTSAFKIISCSNRNIYIANAEGLFLYQSGKISKVWEPDTTQPHNDEIGGMAVEGNSVYFASAFQGLHLVDGEKVKKIYAPGNVAAGLCIKDQQVYYFSSGGIYRSDINADSMTKISEVSEELNLLPGCLIVDNENNIWLGLHDNLLYQKPRSIFVYEPVRNDVDLELYSILQLKNGTLLLGAHNGKVYQKKDLHLVNYFRAKRAMPGAEIKNMYEDKRGWLWIGSGYEGVFVYRNNKIDHFTKEDGLGTGNINFFFEDHSGNMYAGGNGTISRISIDAKSGNLKFENFNHPGKGQNFEIFKSCISGPDGTLWLSGQEGIFNLKEGHLQKYYLAKRGDVNISGMIKDKKGNVWLATRSAGIWQCYFDGNNLLKLKRIFNSRNGLISEVYLSIEEGIDYNIWAAGYDGITCLKTGDKQILISNFTVGNGFSLDNYQSLKLYKGLTDTLWIATSSGLSFLKMGEIMIPPKKIQLKITGIYFFEPGKKFDKISPWPTGEVILPYHSNNLEIKFKAISLSHPDNIQYSYRLIGLPDTSWLDWVEKEVAIFQNLPPGNYVFQLKSKGMEGLYSGPESFTFQIERPFWLTTWFWILVGFCLACLLYFLGRQWRQRITKRHQKKLNEEKQISENFQYMLAEEQVTNYFTNLISDSNSESELLWDVCKKCISKLNFEDCVIYLLNENKNLLEQKAAWGPKLTEDKQLNKQIILSPLSIKVGHGIVGSVAASGQPEIINDLTLDNRYIVDDEVRLSEIAVPIMYEGKVLGIIDSENRRKNFYTSFHLQILTSIAAHCAERIVKLRAEINLHKKRMQLLVMHEKLAEERLVALRSQMNPHFIFNCLNSIQQFILIGDVDKANKYLSQFSKLIRMVLQNSESNLIRLNEEINFLKLYLALEKTRFGESFEYQIYYDTELETEEISIPNLMIQPFVENAIWHGLMHKESNRKLSVVFRELKNNILECIVLDNGIGRKKAKEIKEHHSINIYHKSKGMKLIEEKLALLKTHNGRTSSVEVEDVIEDGEIAGTRVCLRIVI